MNDYTPVALGKREQGEPIGARRPVGAASSIVDFPGGSVAIESSPNDVREVTPAAQTYILVVDDDATHRDIVVRIVVGAGFEVHTAGDGEEAWQALTRAKYDLLITDHEMPRLKGLELIERLRAFSDAPPCILISGSLPSAEWIIKETVRPGAFLAKPFTMTELIETIVRLLGSGASGAY